MFKSSLIQPLGSALAAAALALVPAAARAGFTTYASEATWQAAAGGTQLETFESYSVGTQFMSLPALGVAFAELEGGGYPVIYQHSAATTPYGNKHLANFPNGINAVNRYAAIVLSPQSGLHLTALGFYNGDGQADTMTATAYDSDGNVLGSIGAFKGAFAGFTSSTPVAKVIFGGNTGDGWNHIDGLQTSVVAVPEPSTLWMLALGFAAFGIKLKQPKAVNKDA